MYELFQALRMTHIAFGSVALVAFWVPIAAAKGGKLHVRIGWTYAACMSFVVLTAFLMSGLAYGFPLDIRHFDHVLTNEEAMRHTQLSRQFAIFLAFLGGVTLAAGWQGIGVLRARKKPNGLRNPFTLTLNAVVVLAAIVVLSIGVREHNWTFVGMSAVGFVAVGNLAYLLRKPQTKMHWWYEHVSSMIGTAIAAYTAFLVFGGARLMPGLASSPYYVAVWLLPTAIGAPAIALTIAYYRRKFHDNGKPLASARAGA